MGIARKRSKIESKKQRSQAGKGAELSSCCAWDGDTLVLNILGSPSAKRDVIGKIKGKQLCVSVIEKPVAGRATDHMVRFLAEEFGVSPKAITVVFGRFNVNKQLRITSPQKLPSVLSRLSLNEEIPAVAPSAHSAETK